MGFAERLREQRKKLGMTTTQCAAELGITQPAYNQWELGVREPKFLMLKQLCSLLDISADQLLGTDRGTSAANKVMQRGNGNISQIGNGNTARDCSNCASKQLADLMKQLGITVADLASVAAKKSAAKPPRKK